MAVGVGKLGRCVVGVCTWVGWVCGGVLVGVCRGDVCVYHSPMVALQKWLAPPIYKLYL